MFYDKKIFYYNISIYSNKMQIVNILRLEKNNKNILGI